MTAATALARLRHLGVAVAVRGDGLALRPGSAVPADLLAELRLHKRELLSLLTEPANNPAPGPPAAALDAAAVAAVSALGDDWTTERPPAPPPLPEPNTTDRTTPDARQAQMVAGLMAAASIRPPSWWDARPHSPTPGTSCSCCGGRRWWTTDRQGWCCVLYHPDPTGAGRVVTT